MKHIKVLILSLIISLLSLPSWAEVVSSTDIVWREGFYYKKFTIVPFTGKVTGLDNGRIKDGNREGLWILYHKNGQLYKRENYKNGRLDGSYEGYSNLGKLIAKGTLRNGKKDGHWEYHNVYGLYNRSFYKDGKKHGIVKHYSERGFLTSTETYKNGVKQ